MVGQSGMVLSGAWVIVEAPLGAAQSSRCLPGSGAGLLPPGKVHIYRYKALKVPLDRRSTD